MMTNLKVGDRYAGMGGVLDGIIWEIIEFDGEFGKSKLIQYKGRDRQPGDIVRIDAAFYSSENWKYLGNFSKSNNFQQIFDILNAD